MSRFLQVSHMPNEAVPLKAMPHLASFTINSKSYLGRVVFLTENGQYDETENGTKAVFLYEQLPPASPNTQCIVYEFYKGICPGSFVEIQGKVISTFTPGFGYIIHGVIYEDKNVFTRE